MLKGLAIFAVFLAVTQAPMPAPRQTARSSAQSGNQNKNQGSHQKNAPTPNSPSLHDPSQSNPTDKNGKQIDGEDKENSVKLTSLPPITIADRQITLRDRVLEWGPWIFNALLAIAALIQSGLLYRTWREINRQANAMDAQAIDTKTASAHTETLALQAVRQSNLTQRQLDLANRPWICIDSFQASSPLQFREDGGLSFFVSYQIRNLGGSVAQHIQPWVEPIITGIHNPAEIRERISSMLKRPVNSTIDHGVLVFPGQIHTNNTYPVVIRKEVLDNAIANSPFIEGGQKLPCLGFNLFVCFDYQSTLDPIAHHQTQSIYIVSRIDPKHGNMGSFYPSKRSYFPLVIGYQGAGAYAD